MLTVVTEVFGVKGNAGDMEIAPALMKEQFDESGTARLTLSFAGKKFHIIMKNPERLEYENYRIGYAAVDGKEVPLVRIPHGNGKTAVKAVIGRARIEALSEEVHKIEILLKA